MNIKRLQFENYRNLQKGELVPAEEVNIFFGDNAQGKTNLLESVWLFTGGRSFRGAKDGELIAFAQDGLQEKTARLEMDFFAGEREQNAVVTIAGGKRTAVLNGVSKGSASALVGAFCAVVFSPVHLTLVKEGPAERRRFLDAAICQMKPAYAGLLSRYTHTLAQRNALLKDISYHSELLDTLEIWEEKLARYGGAIAAQRLLYIHKLTERARGFYSGISSGKESFSAQYRSTFCENETIEQKDLIEILLKKLKEARKEDIAAGFTGAGPHRDDLEMMINGISARSFGSQGQQRSCVLALKLAEASILKEEMGEKPIVLLDDVMSELDTSRQDYLLNRLRGWQVFITCCDPAPLLRMIQGKAFEVKNGQFFSK